MSNRAKISVIIPVYNVEKYLAECLESVAVQTFGDMEIICIDDESEDSSFEILENFAKKEPRLRVFKQPHSGQGAARNLGISMAEGEYVLFLDSDDFIERNLVEICTKEILKYSPDVAVFGVKTYNEKNGKSRKGQYSSRRFPRVFGRKRLFKFHTISCNKIYRRNFLIENKIDFATSKTGEEQLFFLKVMLLAKRVSVIKKDLYFYRKNREGSLTACKSKLDFSPIENFYNIETFISGCEISHGLKQQILGRYILKAVSWYPKAEVSIRSEYYEKLVQLFQKAQGLNGKYWWDYFRLRENMSYFAVKAEYLAASVRYFVSEKLIFIPAFCLFVSDFLIDLMKGEENV